MFSKKTQEVKVVERTIQEPGGSTKKVVSVYPELIERIHISPNKILGFSLIAILIVIIFAWFFTIMGYITLPNNTPLRHALITNIDTGSSLSISSNKNINFVIWEQPATPTRPPQASGFSSETLLGFNPCRGDVIFMRGGLTAYFPFDNRGTHRITITCERGRESTSRFSPSLGLTGLAALLGEE